LQVVAIKQLNRDGNQGNKEFLVEVLMLSLLHHQNLVNLVGYCADGDQRLLVYEYMPLGSLEDHLHGKNPCCFCYIGPVQINLLGTYRCFCVATVRIWATGCFSHVLLQYTLSICYVVYPNLSASHHLFHDCDTFGSEVLLPMQRVTCTVSSRFSNLVILWLHFQKISNIT
jgi:hypothetical protein